VWIYCSWRNHNALIGKITEPFRIEFEADFSVNASTDQSNDRITRDIMLLAIDNISLVGCDSNGLFILSLDGFCTSWKTFCIELLLLTLGSKH
jgi:hypothetical protein